VDAALVALETNVAGMLSLSPQKRRLVPPMDDKSQAFCRHRPAGILLLRTSVCGSAT
jgi:hypothetical protein